MKYPIKIHSSDDKVVLLTAVIPMPKELITLLMTWLSSIILWTATIFSLATPAISLGSHKSFPSGIFFIFFIFHHQNQNEAFGCERIFQITSKMFFGWMLFPHFGKFVSLHKASIDFTNCLLLWMQLRYLCAAYALWTFLIIGNYAMNWRWFVAPEPTKFRLAGAGS